MKRRLTALSLSSALFLAFTPESASMVKAQTSGQQQSAIPGASDVKVT